MAEPGKRKPKDSAERKHRRFAQYYIINFDPIEAYNAAGYKAKGNSAASYASQLLRNSKIQQYIKEEIEAQKERLELDQDRVLREHMRIAFSDFKDYAKWDEGEFTWKSSDELTEDQSHAIEWIEFIENITEYAANRRLKIKLYNKTPALEALSKHIGLYEKDNKQKTKDETSEVSGLSGLLNYDPNSST